MSDQASTTTALQGLGSDEAAARLAADGPNELPSGRDRGWLAQILDVVRQPMTLLLLVAVLGVPGLRAALGFGPLDIDVALVAGAAASAGLLWFEGWKAVSRRRAEP